MGSICYIITDPERWKVHETEKKLKEEYGGENLLKVCYGSLDDDPDGVAELEMYMRQSVYQKIKEGEYKVSPNSKWQYKLILINKAGDEVPRLGASCY